MNRSVSIRQAQSRFSPAAGMALLLICLPVVSLHGQAVKASLVGTITDISGAVVPGVEVVLTEVNTNLSRTAIANERGYYVFGNLNPGVYRVEAKVSGFKTAVRDAVDVLVNTTVRVDLQLQPGEITELIEVTAAAAPLLQTDRSDVGRKIETRQLEDLPLVMNRNFQGLVNLTPGTSRSWRPHSEFFNPQDSLSTQANGQSRLGNNVQIEGVDNNHRTGLLTALIPPIEALQTVDVTTSNYDAELGRAAGAVVNVVLKSGTNDFHGSVYAFNRVNALYARNYFSSSDAPHTVFNQFGVTLGGPIIKDKTFFFADYQGLWDRRGDFRRASIPSMAWRAGDLSSASTIIYDPATGTADGRDRIPFSDNKIPDSRISPLSKKILALVPPPTSPQLQNNYETATVREKDTHAFDVKIDHKLQQFDTLSFRYSFSRPKILDPGLFGDAGGGGKGFAGTGIQKAQNLAFSWTHIFQPRFITDFRFGVMRYRNDAKNQDSGTNASDDLGIKGVNLDWFTSGLTGINIDGFSNPVVGYSASLPWVRAETNFDFVSNWTYVKANHTIKWGADVRRNRDDLLQTQTYSPRGLWIFRPGPTARNGDPKTSFANAFASFLLDLPNEYGRDLPGIFPTFRQTQIFTYFQDKWQVNPKLTLDLGVRYEIYLAASPAVPGGFSNYNPNNNTLELAGLGSIPWDSGTGTDWKNIAPRFGIAYRIADKTVIRGGFGITIDPSYPDDKWAYNYPVKQNNAYNALNSYSTAGAMADGFPAPLPVVLPPGGILDAPLESSYLSLPTPLRQGYVQSWNLAIQRAMPYNFAFEAAYVGNHSVGQQIRQNINAGALPGLGAAGQPLYVKFGRRATTNTWTPLPANYNALQVKMDRRFSNGFALTTAYTFSKAMNYDDDNGSIDIPINFGLNRGRAGYDGTHTYVQSFIYDLPIGPGKRWLDTGPAALILGGWQFTGVLSGYTGSPFTVGYSSTALNAPGNSQRANMSALPTIYHRVGVGEKWFDTSVFSAPASATFGNSGRNIIDGPGFVNLDMSVFKKIRITERVNTELRLEMFNATNTPHFNNPGTTLGSSNFGEVRSSFGERQIQLGVKITF